jgi:hypothetical protein
MLKLSTRCKSNYSSCTGRSSENICSSSGGAQEKGKRGWGVKVWSMISRPVGSQKNQTASSFQTPICSLQNSKNPKPILICGCPLQNVWRVWSENIIWPPMSGVGNLTDLRSPPNTLGNLLHVITFSMSTQYRYQRGLGCKKKKNPGWCQDQAGMFKSQQQTNTGHDPFPKVNGEAESLCQLVVLKRR